MVYKYIPARKPPGLRNTILNKANHIQTGKRFPCSIATMSDNHWVYSPSFIHAQSIIAPCFPFLEKTSSCTIHYCPSTPDDSPMINKHSISPSKKAGRTQNQPLINTLSIQINITVPYHYPFSYHYHIIILNQTLYSKSLSIHMIY